MVEKMMLQITATVEPKTGKTIITWKYGEHINAYYLIGVLETVKLDLLQTIAEHTKNTDKEIDDSFLGEDD